MPKRFQIDSQWQQGFRELVRATREQREHVECCKQLHEAGAYDAARDELALADEAQERIELLEHQLREL